MKYRQHKKLCKKSYEILMEKHKALGVDTKDLEFHDDSGLHVNWYSCSHEYDEWDYSDCWYVLRDIYFSEFTDYEGRKMKFIGKVPTPANVFKWARNL